MFGRYFAARLDNALCLELALGLDIAIGYCNWEGFHLKILQTLAKFKNSKIKSGRRIILVTLTI